MYTYLAELLSDLHKVSAGIEPTRTFAGLGLDSLTVTEFRAKFQDTLASRLAKLSEHTTCTQIESGTSRSPRRNISAKSVSER